MPGQAAQLVLERWGDRGDLFIIYLLSGGEGETVSADLLIGTDSPIKSNTVEVLERVESEGGHEVIMVLSQAQCSR